MGAASSEVYHVFEAKAAVPRNAMFVQVPVGEAPHPSGHATFSLPASPAAVQQWAAATYGHAGALDAQGALAAAWACVRDGSHLIVTAGAAPVPHAPCRAGATRSSQKYEGELQSLRARAAA